MLVLKRNLGERIMIGGDVSVMVVEIGSNWVKLGTDAPSDTRILREELLRGKPLHKIRDDMDDQENRNRRNS